MNACAVTPDGRHVVSASQDSTLKVWDLETVRPLATLEGHTTRNENEPAVRPARALLSLFDSCLDHANVFGARTLGAATFVIRDLLAFAQILEANALDGRHVEKHVGAGAIRDETKTLISQTFDRTLRHS